jgi:uncharacterized membrane protein
MIWNAPALAGLAFCNQTSEKMGVAIAYHEQNHWRSIGWYIVKPGDCTIVIGGPLDQEYYWFSAHTQDMEWTSPEEANTGVFCTSTNPFNYIDSNRSDCEHHVFSRIDTGQAANFTQPLDELRTGPLEAAEACAGQVSDGLEAFTSCWMRSRSTVSQRRILDCTQNYQDKADIALCAADGVLPAQAYQAAKCVSDYDHGDDEAELVSCVAKGNVSPEAQRALDCALKSDDDLASYSFVTCVGSQYLTDDQTKILDCVSQNSDSYEDAALCVASSRLPPEASKALGCVLDNDDYLSMGVCAAGGDSLTPEQRTFASCAIETGGQPYAFAVCFGSQTTINELQKCLTQGIGGHGCFGDDNTAVKFVNDAWKDVTQGPGAKNDLFGADGWTATALGNAASDIRNGPGHNNEIVGGGGFLARTFHW